MGGTFPPQYNQHPLAGSCRMAALSGEGGGCVGRSSGEPVDVSMTPSASRRDNAQHRSWCTSGKMVHDLILSKVR